MNKIIKLTESDLRNLVKRIVKEQTVPNINDFPDWPQKAKKYLGKTANLYSDPQNKKFITQIRITNAIVKTDGTVKLETNSDTAPYSYTYNCTKPNMLQPVGGSYHKIDKYYSNELTPMIQQDFCTKNSKGVSVPIGAFASNKSNQSNLA